MTVAEAHHALAKAEQAIGDARAARDRARDDLDQALASRGWRRMTGAFAPDATPLYQRPGNDGAWPLHDVLEILTLEQKATA